jgi:hypothetical protein
LIPPRPGVSQFWAAQVRDVNGKLVRRSRLNSGLKVKGELKPNCDPKKIESWTNMEQALQLCSELVTRRNEGLTFDDGIFRFNKKQLSILLKPCTYEFYERGILLYVGSGRTVGRPLSGSHHRRQDLENADMLIIHPHETPADALEHETLIRRTKKPRLNGKWHAIRS